MMGPASEPLIDVQGLSVAFPQAGGVTHAVRDVSFQVGRERLGIVGESGSGKSSVCRALLGLIPAPAIVSARRMSFAGEDLQALSASGWQRIRGRRIGMVMQDPKYSLNPVMRVGPQIAETLRHHHRISSSEARKRTVALLEQVSIHDPERVWRLFPHEVSGGMGQRIMIAMMLAPEPDMLFADEPTSALDVTIAAQVMSTLDQLVRHRGMGLVLVSHNLDLVSRFCDRILVMYAGRIVECVPAQGLEAASHPYTRGLLASRPQLDVKVGTFPTLERDPAWLR